jgi:hypothetical protein
LPHRRQEVCRTYRLDRSASVLNRRQRGWLAKLQSYELTTNTFCLQPGQKPERQPDGAGTVF